MKSHKPARATRHAVAPPETYDPDKLTISLPTQGFFDDGRLAGALTRKAEARAMASTYRKPEVQAAVLQSKFGANTFPGMDLNWLVSELESSNAKIKAGDLSDAEGMLFSQAHALSAIFTSLAQRAHLNFGEHLSAGETYLRLALKAQSQCRATLETLAAIKNPPVIYAKQANIAHGPQQVNNGGQMPERSHAGNTESEPNKLSRVTHEEGQRLDLGGTPASSAAHSRVAAVGAIDRAEVERGESDSGLQRMERRYAADDALPGEAAA